MVIYERPRLSASITFSSEGPHKKSQKKTQFFLLSGWVGGGGGPVGQQGGYNADVQDRCESTRGREEGSASKPSRDKTARQKLQYVAGRRGRREEPASGF